MIYLKKNNEESISKSRIIDLIKLIDPNTDFNSKKPKDYNKLHSRYLNRYKSQQFIKSDDLYRGRIKLTDYGLFTAKIFCAFYAIDLINVEKSIEAKFKNTK